LWGLTVLVAVEGIVLVLVVISLRKLWQQRIRGDELIAIEERVLELMGKFKQLADTKIKMLDMKIEQLKSLVQQANNVLSALNVLVSNAEQSFAQLEEALEEAQKQSVAAEILEEAKRPTSRDVAKTGKAVDSNSTDTRKRESEEELGVEKRILMLSSQGYDEITIARRLGIGVGEVRLILSLFSRKFVKD